MRIPIIPSCKREKERKIKSILFKYMSKFTSLSEEEQKAIAEDILIEEYKKGTVLLRQGDVPTKCYFVLQGCVRQGNILITLGMLFDWRATKPTINRCSPKTIKPIDQIDSNVSRNSIISD